MTLRGPGARLSAAREVLRRGLAANAETRMFLAISCLVTVACVGLSIVFGRQHVAQIREGLAERSRAVTGFLAREAELGILAGDRESLVALAAGALAQRDVVYARVLDENGAALASVGAPSPKPTAHSSVAVVRQVQRVVIGDDLWEFRSSVWTRDGAADDALALLGATVGGDAGPRKIGTVVVGVSLEGLHAEHRLALMAGGGIAAGVTLLAILAGAWLTRRSMHALVVSAELAEERAEVANLRSRFVSNASHEFRTPLAVILAASDTLKRYHLRMSRAQQEARLDKIQGAVRQMKDLLDDVLTFGRIDAGAAGCVRQEVDLRRFCEGIAEDARTTLDKSQRLVVSVSGRPSAHLDPKLVGQSLRNLLENAARYSPAGGTIELQATCEGERVRFSVKDSGIGIRSSDLEHLFEPFVRGSNVEGIQGTGLGLAITKRAIELHGGDITVESAEGAGSTFAVSIPSPAGGAA